MTVVRSTPDAETLTLTMVADLAATPTRVWQLWADPRQLERWWGPPEWPATFTRHDMRVGGRSSYRMTGPDDRELASWWQFLAIDEPRSLEVEEGTAHPDGSPDHSWPVTRMRVEIAANGAGTRMTIVSTFASADQMQQLLDMQMLEGMRAAMGQLDQILAED